MASFFNRFKKNGEAVAQAAPPAVQLDLSGPVLTDSLKTLLMACEEDGGVERYVEAVKFKISLFQDAFKDGGESLTPENFIKLCMFMPTVRRRIGDYVEPENWPLLHEAIKSLFKGGDVDARIRAFEKRFPQDKKHRWVHDLATEILHNTDPELYPLMHRWVWDRKTNSGVIREIWYGDVDNMVIEVDNDYETFLKLREELSQWLTENGVFADIPIYVDLLCAHVYGGYIASQGGLYLKADFSSKEPPIHFTRRLLGLDGVPAKSRLAITSSVVDGEGRRVKSILRLGQAASPQDAH